MAARWNRVAVAALAAVAAAAVLVVVSGDPPPEQVPDPPSSPVLLPGDTAWTRIGGLSATPGSPGVRDGLALLSFDGLWLVDLRTGAERWHVQAGAQLAGGTEVYSSGGTLVGAGVLVRTRGGIALLSREDGGMRWHAPVRSAPGERYVLVAADDRTAVVSVGPTRGGTPRVVAVDVATGRPRWTRAGLTPYAIADGVVAGVTAAGTVAAWDLASGATAWTLAGFTSARVALTAGDDVLVEGRTGSSAPVRRVVSARTGELLAELAGDPRTGQCATDGRTLIACPLSRGRDYAFEIFDVGERRIRAVSGDYEPRSVCLAGPDHLFGASQDGYFAVDRTGQLLAPALPGRPVAVSGNHLVIRTDTGDPPLISVYRMRK